MTEREGADRGLEARARELYWHSDRGVNSIAEELDLSKSRFYELLDPLPSGVPCPDCGHPLVYENRTARERGEAICLEGCVDPLAELAPDLESSAPMPLTVDTRRLLAGAMIGAAACLLLFRMVRR